jgi:hypothetical protein
LNFELIKHGGIEINNIGELIKKWQKN